MGFIKARPGSAKKGVAYKKKCVSCFSQVIAQKTFVFSLEHDFIRGGIRPSVRGSVTTFFGGQKQRRQITYAVYPALFLHWMKSSRKMYDGDNEYPTEIIDDRY